MKWVSFVKTTIIAGMRNISGGFSCEIVKIFYVIVNNCSQGCTFLKKPEIIRRVVASSFSRSLKANVA